jgi:RNA polymerase sigma factor (TIGR02999 family)
MRLITQLLKSNLAGDAYAHEALVATTYKQLRALAEKRMQDEGDQRVLRSAGLVNDCCLVFAANADMNGCDWPQFLAFAPAVMRKLVLDLVECSAAERRRGASAHHLVLRPAISPCLPGDEATILWMDRAIESLEVRDPRLAQVARMVYLSGYTAEEAADALCITQRSALREWLKVLTLLSVEHVPGSPFLPAQGMATLAQELFSQRTSGALPGALRGRPH